MTSSSSAATEPGSIASGEVLAEGPTALTMPLAGLRISCAGRGERAERGELLRLELQGERADRELRPDTRAELIGLERLVDVVERAGVEAGQLVHAAEGGRMTGAMCDGSGARNRLQLDAHVGHLRSVTRRSGE